MFRTVSIMLLTVLAVACGGGGANGHVVSPRDRAIKFTEWSKRDAAVPLWPESAKRVQVVVTGGYAAGDHMFWVVEQGTTLLAVYRVGAAELGDAMTAVVNTTRPTAASPLAAFMNGGQGIVLGPPPPPPIGPIGFPEPTIEAVIDYASHVDAQALELEHQLGAAAAR